MPDRRIYFYAIENADEQRPFDRIAAAQRFHVDGLADVPEDEWIVHRRGSYTAAIVDTVGTATTPTYLRFLRLRDDRPFIIGRSRETRLLDIEQDDRVTDFTFAALWPDGYMAAIASRDAPDIRRLSEYFQATSGQVSRIVPLYATDIVQRLRAMRQRGLTQAKVKIHTSAAEQMAQDDQVTGFSQLWRAGSGTDAVTIEVKLSVDRYKDRVLAPEVGAEIERLVSYGDLLDQLWVKGIREDGERDEVNLKKQRVFRPVTYQVEDTPATMYGHLRAARREAEDPEQNGAPLANAARLG